MSSVDPEEANKPLLPAVPEPVPEMQSMYETVLALKQAVELLLGHRAPKTTAGDTGVTSGVKVKQTILSIQQINDEFQVQSTANHTLTTKVQEVEGGIEAVASDVTTLQTDVVDLENNQSAQASAISSLETRVTTNEGDITSTSTSLTNLQAEVTTLDSTVSGNSSAISTLESRVTVNEGDITAQSSDITNLQSTITTKNTVFRQTTAPTANVVGDIWFDTDDGNKPYYWNGSSWLDTASPELGMEVLVWPSPPDPGVVGPFQVGALWFDSDDDNKVYRWNGSAWVDIADTRPVANASAISSLDTRVTSAEGDITANASSITTLQSDVTDLESGQSAQASAISSLETDVSSIDGDLSSLSTSFTGVFTNSPGGDTAALFRMNAVSAPTGYDSSIRLEVRASLADTFGASKAAMIMDASASGDSRIRFMADRLVMAQSPGHDGTPFAEFTGAKITFSTDVEIDGDLLVTGSVNTSGLASDAVTESALDSGDSLFTTTNQWEDIAILPLTIVAGEKVLLFHQYSAYSIESGVGNRWGVEHRILYNGSLLDGPFTVIQEGNGLGDETVDKTVWRRYTPSAGSATYKIQARRVGSGGSGSNYAASVLALGNKR